MMASRGTALGRHYGLVSLRSAHVALASAAGQESQSLRPMGQTSPGNLYHSPQGSGPLQCHCHLSLAASRAKDPVTVFTHVLWPVLNTMDCASSWLTFKAASRRFKTDCTFSFSYQEYTNILGAEATDELFKLLHLRSQLQAKSSVDSQEALLMLRGPVFCVGSAQASSSLR